MIERLKAMALDHAILCFTILPIVMGSNEVAQRIGYSGLTEMSMLLFFGMYINKDFLRGRSAAKRILGQVVIDIKTGKEASPLKCTIRNFTDLLWIIEVIVIQFSPNRRIGDFIANTKVVRTKKENIRTMLSDFKEANTANWMTSLGIAIIYAWAFISVTKQVLWF